MRQNQMNNPSPFQPESPVAEPKNQSRIRVRTAVTLVFAANFIALMALLIIGFGCRKPSEPDAPPAETNTMTMPAFDTNLVSAVSTNAPGTTATAYIPPVPEPAVPVVTSSAQEYVIIKGDYLEKIAKDHGLTTKALQDANPGVDSKKLKIGQKIQIPAAPVAPVAGSSVNAPTADVAAPGEQIHKVKSGDTLTTIAKHYGVSVKALRSANSLTTDKIKVGDKLKIPAKAAAPAPEAPAYVPPTTVPKPL